MNDEILSTIVNGCYIMGGVETIAAGNGFLISNAANMFFIYNITDKSKDMDKDQLDILLSDLEDLMDKL